jgi:hypothetical protein
MKVFKVWLLLASLVVRNGDCDEVARARESGAEDG